MKERLYSLDLLRGLDMFRRGFGVFLLLSISWRRPKCRGRRLAGMSCRLFGRISCRDCGARGDPRAVWRMSFRRPCGGWILTPEFKDEYASDRLRWQFWTLRYND